MTPTHAIFRQVFSVCKLVMDTYDFLPDGQARYPFCYVGEQIESPNINFEMYGECTQTVHIYATRNQRSEIDNLSSLILDGLRTQDTAYKYNIKYINHNLQTIPDNTDVQPLLHMVIDVRFSYTRKEK